MVFSVGNAPAWLHSVPSSEPGSAQNVAGSPQADGARAGSCSLAVWKTTAFGQWWGLVLFLQGLIKCLPMGWPVRLRCAVTPNTCPPQPYPRLPVPSPLADILPPITPRAAGPHARLLMLISTRPSPTAPNRSPRACPWRLLYVIAVFPCNAMPPRFLQCLGPPVRGPLPPVSAGWNAGPSTARALLLPLSAC